MNLRNMKAEKLKDEVRKLALKEENKTCMDCGMRGPLYVVLDFNIFVCTLCSGIHRSLQHRVKGISMSEFVQVEVDALKACGNKRAAAIWRKGYQGNLPQPGDERGLRNLMHDCYEAKRFFDGQEFALLEQEIYGKPVSYAGDVGVTPQTALPIIPPSIVLTPGGPNRLHRGTAGQEHVATHAPAHTQTPPTQTPPAPVQQQPAHPPPQAQAPAPPQQQQQQQQPSVTQTDLFDFDAPKSAPPPSAPAGGAGGASGGFDDFFSTPQRAPSMPQGGSNQNQPPQQQPHQFAQDLFSGIPTQQQPPQQMMGGFSSGMPNAQYGNYGGGMPMNGGQPNMQPFNPGMMGGGGQFYGGAQGQYNQPSGPQITVLSGNLRPDYPTQPQPQQMNYQYGQPPHQQPQQYMPAQNMGGGSMDFFAAPQAAPWGTGAPAPSYGGGGGNNGGMMPAMDPFGFPGPSNTNSRPGESNAAAAPKPFSDDAFASLNPFSGK